MVDKAFHPAPRGARYDEPRAAPAPDLERA